MKKIGLLIIGTISLLFSACSFTYAQDYEYTNLDITANVQIDGTIDIKEIFTANFFVSKHGIIRDIPLKYSIEGGDFHIDISNINVEGKTFTTNKTNGNIEIKIGDTNKTLIGEQNYPISYSTYGLIKNFSGMGYAELYWNLVGYDFDTNINSTKAEIILPKKNSFTSEDFLITIDGKENSIGSFPGKIDWSKGDKIIITYDKKLYPKEGIAIAIKFPNDYFIFDYNKQSSLYSKDDNKKFQLKSISTGAKITIYTIGFILFLFGLMYISENLIKKKIEPVKIGNNFNSKYPIVVQYAPPKGMNSAEAGLLFNCREDLIDITSLFYQWVNDKLMRINYDRDTSDSTKIKNITFIKIKDMPESYPYYERELFNDIFKDKNSKIINENSGLNKIISIQGLKYFGLGKHWILKKKKSTFWRSIYSILFIVLLALGFYYFKRLGFLFVIFFVPLFYGITSEQDNKIKLTEEGEKLAAHVIGYAKFIKECDENILKTFLKEDPLFIDKSLPYAVAFGMETEFLNKVVPLLKSTGKSGLNSNNSITFSVLDTISFMRNILSKSINKRNIFHYGLRSIYGQGNYNKSYGKHSNLSLDYSKISGFNIGSVFSNGGKFFKKGGGGGGGGSKSW